MIQWYSLSSNCCTHTHSSSLIIVINNLAWNGIKLFGYGFWLSYVSSIGNKSVFSTFGDHHDHLKGCQIDTRQDKKKISRPMSMASQHVQSSHRLRIIIQNAFIIGQKQETHYTGLCLVWEKQHFKQRMGRRRRRRKKTVKRSMSTINHQDKTRGLVIPIMSRDIKNEYNLMTNIITSSLRVNTTIYLSLNDPRT